MARAWIGWARTLSFRCMLTWRCAGPPFSPPPTQPTAHTQCRSLAVQLRRRRVPFAQESSYHRHCCRYVCSAGWHCAGRPGLIAVVSVRWNCPPKTRALPTHHHCRCVGRCRHRGVVHSLQVLPSTPPGASCSATAAAAAATTTTTTTAAANDAGAAGLRVGAWWVPAASSPPPPPPPLARPPPPPDGGRGVEGGGEIY